MRTTTRTTITRITDRITTGTGPPTATVTGIIDDRITDLIGAMVGVGPAVSIGDGTSKGPSMHEARSGLVGKRAELPKEAGNADLHLSRPIHHRRNQRNDGQGRKSRGSRVQSFRERGRTAHRMVSHLRPA